MPVRNIEGEASNKNLIARAFDLWRAGTGGPYGLLAERATWTIVGNSVVARRYENRQDFLDNVIGPLNGRMKAPLVPVVRALYADGDWVIALFDAAGTARDGLPCGSRQARSSKPSPSSTPSPFNDLSVHASRWVAV
jgi:ketosteroid isomerase-like protein